MQHCSRAGHSSLRIMPQLITSISGIRGIPGVSLDPETISAFSAAYATLCKPGQIVLGTDGRPSGRAIKDIVRGVLVMSGRDVIDLGVVPTPTVQLRTEHSEAAGGIAITASHNPSEWNGLKFLNSAGVFLDLIQFQQLLKAKESATKSFVVYEKFGQVCKQTDALHHHIEAVLAFPGFDLDAIKKRKFTVVVDAVNASGSRIVPEFLQELGCTVIRLHCDGTGLFPHTPEPLPQNLTGLAKAVVMHSADMGIAVDPDADRLVLYTEKGEPFGEEYTITAAVDSYLSASGKSGHTVVVNLSTTRAVDDVAVGYGAEVLRSAVGEINVVEKMKISSAIIGGEGSGGVILPAIHYGRDSLIGIALVLDILARRRDSVSSYRKSLPNYFIRKFKYSTVGIDVDVALKSVLSEFSAAKQNVDDGVRIDLDEGWVQLRKSNTEPIIRVIAEASTDEKALILAKNVAAIAFGIGATALP